VEGRSREMVQIIKDVQNALGTFVTVTVIHPDIAKESAQYVLLSMRSIESIT